VANEVPQGTKNVNFCILAHAIRGFRLEPAWTTALVERPLVHWGDVEICNCCAKEVERRTGHYEAGRIVIDPAMFLPSRVE
jgi:hypothetical protein